MYEGRKGIMSKARRRHVRDTIGYIYRASTGGSPGRDRVIGGFRGDSGGRGVGLCGVVRG